MPRHVGTIPDQSGRSSLLRTAALVCVAGGLVVGSLAGVASAKGGVGGGGGAAGGGGGGGGTSATCDPVSSLTYKGDATTGDTNLSTVQVSYSVKPCSNGQTVTVDTQVALLADQTQKVYEQTGAALSGRFTTVVVANTSYLATVTVHDADTGDLVGSSTIFVAALRKRV